MCVWCWAVLQASPHIAPLHDYFPCVESNLHCKVEWGQLVRLVIEEEGTTMLLHVKRSLFANEIFRCTHLEVKLFVVVDHSVGLLPQFLLLPSLKNEVLPGACQCRLATLQDKTRMNCTLQTHTHTHRETLHTPSLV